MCDIDAKVTTWGLDWLPAGNQLEFACVGVAGDEAQEANG